MNHNTVIDDQIQQMCIVKSCDTLFTFGCDQAVSCMYIDPLTQVGVIGCCNGSLRLVFPMHPYGNDNDNSSNSGGGDDDDDVVDRNEQENGFRRVEENGKSADEINVDILNEDEDKHCYRFVLLRKRSNEAIRTAYIDRMTGRLFVTIGDASVQVFNLNKLETREKNDGPGVKCDLYAFDRSHSFGTCVNSHLLQHKYEFLLVVRNSVTMYSLKFPDGAFESGTNLNNETDHDGCAVSRLSELSDGKEAVPARVQPAQKEYSLTTPSNCQPCFFDGKHLVFLKCDKPGEFQVEVRDWQSEESDELYTLLIKTGSFNNITPYGFQTKGKYLLGIVNLVHLNIWDLESSEIVYQLKKKRGGHKSGATIVVARFCYDDDVKQKEEEEEADIKKLLVLSLATDNAIVLWQGGNAIQRIPIPRNKAHFTLGGPYFIQPIFHKTGKAFVQTVWYNDDSGVHVVHIARDQHLER